MHHSSFSAGGADDSPSPLDPPRHIVYELDTLRFARIAELGALNSNLWATISLAAERGEPLTIEQLYQLAAKATRETFALMRSIGALGAVQRARGRFATIRRARSIRSRKPLLPESALRCWRFQRAPAKQGSRRS